MSNFEVPGVFAAVVAGSLLKHVGLRITRNRNVKEYVGTVSQINVFPLKSAKNLQNVTTANITIQGLICDGIGDRHWMVTRKGHYQNMSAFQRLILIQTTKEGNFLRLDAEGMESLRLPLDPEVTDDNLVEVQVKFVPQRAVDCGDAAAQWISTFLKKEGLRLNYSPPSLSKRFSTDVPKEWTTDAKPGEEVAFQDFAHCMIMCDSSVEELSKRVQRNVPAIQFRPNVLVSGTTPFDEDTWKYVFIGKHVKMRFIDDCQRCIITTIDTINAEKDKQGQPLKTLKTFRCKEPFGPMRPVMGIHTNTEVEGTVNVGDPVYVKRK